MEDLVEINFVGLKFYHPMVYQSKKLRFNHSAQPESEKASLIVNKIILR